MFFCPLKHTWGIGQCTSWMHLGLTCEDLRLRIKISRIRSTLFCVKIVFGLVRPHERIFCSGAVLQNQLIEKEMREQNEQQEKKFRDIKIRTEQIRKDYEKRLSRAGAFVPQTYGQGELICPEVV